MAPRIVAVRAPSSHGWLDLALLPGGRAAVPTGDDLVIVDLAAVPDEGLDLVDDEQAPAVMTRLADVSVAGYADDGFVTADRQCVLRRYRHAGAIEEIDAFTLPAELRGQASQPFPTALKVSPSGRFVLVQTTGQANLFEVPGWQRRWSTRLYGPAGLASFTRLPSGAEVLFISAPRYSGVTMIDCSSGQIEHQFEPDSGFDFCHQHFALSPDGTRLHAYGCTWAAPPSARIYDMTAWTGTTMVARSEAPVMEPYRPPRFELRTVYERREGERGGGEALSIPATPGADGLVTCVTVVERAMIAVPGTEDDDDYRDGASDDDLAALDGLQAVEPHHPIVIVIRRIDPASGRVVDLYCHGDDATDYQNVHVLPDHRVLLCNQRVRQVDAVRRTVEDIGVMPVRDGHYLSTRASVDLSTVVVMFKPRS